MGLFILDGINKKKIIFLLIYVALVLFVFNIINEILNRPFWQITRLISLGMENNFSTWFSSFIYVIAAYYAFKCSCALGPLGAERWIWQLFALLMLLLSCDETASIHEHFGATFNKYVFHNHYSEIYGSWVYAIAPVALGVLIFFICQLRKQMKGSWRAAQYLMTGAVLLLTGALFFEGLVQYIDRVNYPWLMKFEIICEEMMEIIGSIFITAGLMAHHNFLNRKTAEYVGKS